MWWKIAMVAKGLCDVTRNHPFTLLVTNWSMTATTMSKNTTAAQPTASSNVLWPMPVYGDSANMTDLYEESEVEKQGLERFYAVAEQNVYET